MKKIIKTKYVNLVRFLFHYYRLEKKFPIRDNFILIKDLNHNEQLALNRFTNYIILSNSYFQEEWDRKEILDYVLSVIKTRRKPKFDNMDDDTFEHNIKMLFVADHWESDTDDGSMFDLFKVLDFASVVKYREFFKLLEDYNPQVIFYSILSFINKCHTVQAGEVSGGYYRVLMSKKRNLSTTFKKTIKRYSDYQDGTDETFKLIRFLYDLSEKHV